MRWMKGIAHTCIEIQVTQCSHSCSRLHVEHIRSKSIRTLVRLLEDEIVEVQIESGHRIRNLHFERRLMDLHKLTLVSLVHNDCRIKILSM